jgi:hypothetical protein
MRVYQIVLLALAVGVGVPVALHHQVHGVVSPLQIGLAFFLWLNAIIAFWEICLFLRIDLIEQQHERFIVDYAGRELDRVKEFFTTKVPLGKIFSPTTWAELWSTYSVFDESYANRKSFGFFIDVGNGFSTAVPTLLFLYGMTFELMPARVLGIVGAILFYQMWYGTLVYFGSFLFNKRYVGHTPGNLAIFVGLSNGLWFTFPVVGLWASVRMILDDNYAVFF